MNCSMPGFPVHHNSQSLLKFMSIESVMPSNHLILCRLLLLLPSIFPSIRVFSNESAPRIRWPKYWSFSFSISLSNEYSGLVSFRMDWLDLLAVKGTLKSLFHITVQKHQFFGTQLFMVQQSHPCMTTGDGETVETVRDFMFLGSKITVDGDCSHEIKRRLILARKVMTNLDSVFKSRDIILPTKVCLVNAMVFPVVMYGCESCTIKKAKHQRTDAFELGVGEDS